MWKKVKIGLTVYLLINLVLAYIFWPRIDQFLRFMPRVKPASFTAPITPLEAQRQDLNYLKTILEYDRSFSGDARDAFEARITKLKDQNRQMTSAEFYLTVRALMATADNGHTSAPSGPAFREFNRSGADLYRFSDGYFVVRAHKKHAALLGKKIIALDGRPIEEVVSKLRVYTGGPDHWRDMKSLYLLRSPELLHAAGLAESPDALSLTIIDDADLLTTSDLQALPAVSNMDYYRHAFHTLSPEGLSDEDGNWVRTLNKNHKNLAPYLEDLQNVVLSQPVDSGLYVRSNYLMGTSEFPVRSMLLETLGKTPEKGFDFIALDLRWNPGGDYGNAVPFARDIKSALATDGKIYVITGPDTFSAAIVFAALIKQSAPEQTQLIGAAMGDRPQFWAESGKPFVLPNSGLWISYATGYHDWEKGCAATHKHCFPPNKKYDHDIGELRMDQILEPSFAEYSSGRDVVMDWISDQE